MPLTIREISRRVLRPLKYAELRPFTLLFCGGRLRRGQPLFFLLSLLLGGVLVVVAVVVSRGFL